MVKILMMSAKMATPVLFKIMVFSNKNYYVIYSVYDVTNKILSYDSYYIVDNSYVCRSYRGKTDRENFLPPILNRVKCTVIQIEKALINDCLSLSKVS